MRSSLAVGLVLLGCSPQEPEPELTTRLLIEQTSESFVAWPEGVEPGAPPAVAHLAEVDLYGLPDVYRGDGRLFVQANGPPRELRVGEPHSQLGYSLDAVEERIAAGAPGVSDGTWPVGAVLILDASGEERGRIAGDAPNAQLGLDVSLGDVDADGVLDAISVGLSPTGEPTAWLTLGPLDGEHTIADAAASFPARAATLLRAGQIVSVRPGPDQPILEQWALLEGVLEPQLTREVSDLRLARCSPDRILVGDVLYALTDGDLLERELRHPGLAEAGVYACDGDMLASTRPAVLLGEGLDGVSIGHRRRAPPGVLEMSYGHLVEEPHAAGLRMESDDVGRVRVLDGRGVWAARFFVTDEEVPVRPPGG